MSKYLFSLLLFFISCNGTTENCNDKNIVENLGSTIKEKYQSDYNLDFSNSDNLDFVKLYGEHCEIPYQKDDYKILQSINLFNRVKNNVFYSEFVCFRSPEKLSYFIDEVKAKNCIDPYNIKVCKIYKVNSTMAIFVNYYDFDIVEFEKDILSKIKGVKIFKINEP